MHTIEELQDKFDDLLNEEGPVEIGQLKYDRAHVLKKVDPIAYKEGVLNFADAENIDVDELEGVWDL